LDYKLLKKGTKEKEMTCTIVKFGFLLILSVMLSNIFAQPEEMMISSADKKEKNHHLGHKCILDHLGTVYEVDKFNDFHNYQSLYCDLFRPLRENHIKMLEIGFGCGHHIAGASAKLWNKYFTNLDYYAMDYMDRNNNATVTKCANDFIKENPNWLKHIWLGDQENKTFLKKLVAEYGQEFDIIIDDGGHRSSQIIASFEILWPIVAPGGYYIIEDMAVAPEFADIVSKWIRLIGNGQDTGRIPGDMNSRIPKDVKMIGCAFQICYLRKIAPQHNEHSPKIWGEKYPGEN
jgi:hypothetical protein